MVQPPTGTELIKVITSTRPITIVPDTQFLPGSGPFRSIDGGVRALTRDLQVVAGGPPPADTLVAFNNFALYTVPYRARAAAAGRLCAAAGAAYAPGSRFLPAGGPHFTVPADQPFPLLMAADKASYRIGEKVTIAVTPLAPCNLTVLEFNTLGQTRTLYPVPGAPNPLTPAQALFVSGGPSPMTLPMAGPPGIEQVVAFCAAVDASAPPAPGALPPPPPAPGATPPPPAPRPAAAGRGAAAAAAAGALPAPARRPVELFAGSGRSFLFHVPGRRRPASSSRLHPDRGARPDRARAPPLAGLLPGDLHASIDRNHRPRLRAFDSDGSRPRPIKRRASGRLRAVHAGPRPRPPPSRRPRRRAPRRTKRPGPPSRRRKPSSPGNSSRTPRPAPIQRFRRRGSLPCFRC